MLIGEKTKYLGLIFGIAFSTLLMSQQVTLFFSILNRTGNIIRNMREANIWVMDPKVKYIDEAVSLPDRDISRVKGVNGIEWAVPFYKSMGVVKTRTGHLKQVMILGVDDTSLIGRPLKMLKGTWEDLRQPQSIVMDKAGWEFLFPNTPIELGTEMEFNDTRVIVVGVCEAPPLFATMPIFFARYNESVKLVPQARNRMSFILAKSSEDQKPEIIAQRIQTQTGLQALTSEQFIERSVNYYLKNTAIPINFGLTVMLGFIIGAVVAGQTFYIFIIENLQQFGALKAIGCSNRQILKMVILQALIVAIIGYCIGIGVTSSFFLSVSHLNAFRNIMLPWFVALGTFVAVILIMFMASIFSIRKVFVLDPAVVFRG